MIIVRSMRRWAGVACIRGSMRGRLTFMACEVERWRVVAGGTSRRSLTTTSSAAAAGRFSGSAAAPVRAVRCATFVGSLGIGMAVSLSEQTVTATAASCADPATLILAALVGGAAAYASDLGRQNPQLVDPRHHIMVDCGSGGTRVEKFGCNAEGVYRESLKAPKAQPLDEVLIQDEEQQRAWLAALETALGDDAMTPVLIGATAGVRGAVKSGKVTEMAMERFQKLVSEQFGTRARFALVDGAVEAESELAAVQYCICKESWWDRPTDSIALLSSGGMSAQVTFVSDRKLYAVSLPHEQKLANGRCRDPSVSVLSAESQGPTLSSAVLCEQIGVEKGLSAFEMKLQSLIEQRPMLKEASTASRAGTTFVGIEMIAQVAEAAGVAGHLISVANAQVAVSKLLHEFRTKAARASREEASAWTWKDIRWVSRLMIAKGKQGGMGRLRGRARTW